MKPLKQSVKTRTHRRLRRTPDVRLVLDTNIIISGFLSPGGPPGGLLDLWDEDQHYMLISSEEQIAELMRVTSYPKLRTRLHPACVRDWVLTLRRFALVLGDLPTLNVSPDPKDNFVLAMAQEGQADLLVTGDKRDLLALKMHAGTRIVTAREALERLQS